MKNDWIKLGNMILEIIANIAASWISVCVIYMLITKCFGIDFTWKTATGVWLCTCLLSLTVKK